MKWNKSFEDLNLQLDIDSEFYSIEGSDASESIKVVERYKKGADHDLTVQSVGTWDKNKGLVIPQSEKYERRGNLSGVSLAITALEVSGAAIAKYCIY